MLRLYVILAITIPFYLIVESLADRPIVHIVHRPSQKLVHPLGDSANPSDNTRLVVYDGGFGEKRFQFQFVPQTPGEGYIKHVPSGKYIYPLGGSTSPSEQTPLVLHRDYHKACLFSIDLKNDYIIHKSSGKIWHPYGGTTNPGNNVGVVLHSNRHDRATFYFTNAYGRKIDPSSPYIIGWRALMNEENKSTPPPQNNN